MHLCLLFGPSPGLGHVVVSFAVAVSAVSKANMIVAILTNDLKRACPQRKSRLISTANNKEKPEMIIRDIEQDPTLCYIITWLFFAHDGSMRFLP